MNKRIFAVLLAASILLSGCQLAKPENENNYTDRLAGVFVTTQHVDLWDAEAFLNDNLDEILSGNTDELDAPQHYDKLFAQVAESNDNNQNSRYVFNGIEGYFLASYLVKPDNEQQNEYWSSEVTGGICDAAFSHHSTDTGTENILEGTIYVTAGSAETVFYFNPVYQTEDGRVYLMTGQGMSFGTGMASSATHTLNAERTHTQDGITNTDTTSVKITIAAVDPAVELKILQMDSGNNIVKEASYSVSDAPEALSFDPNTVYIIVEERTKDSSIRRMLYQPGDRNMHYFKTLEGSICIKAQVSLNWQE